MINIIASLLILIAVVLTVLILIALIGWWRGVDSVLFPGFGLVVATPVIIVLLLIMNIGFVIAAAVVKPRKDSNIETISQQNFEYPEDIFGGCGNGTLTTSLAKNPNNYNADTDRHLKVCINGADLESIYDAVFPDRIKYTDYTEAENHQRIEEEHQEMRRQFASEFPMLGRFDNIYEDYVFNPEEVKKLREECLKLQNTKPNSGADLALRKLIYTCDEALKENFYLMFFGD